MWYGVPFLFLVLATTHATWVLETNVDYITPSETKDVQLVCKQDGNVENDKGIQTINGIRIMKLDPFGNKNVFAEIHILTNQPSSTDKNVQVAANLKRGNVAFLKATWPVADDKTEGAYGCEISGYDALDNSVIVKVRPSVQLKTKMLTESDVIDLIQKMTESHVKKQKELEQEIDVLRKFMNENLQSIRRIIRDKDNEVTTKLSNLKNTMVSTYSTKGELKDRVSELKNFTIKRILTDKGENRKELDKLSTLVQNTSSTFDERFSETTKSLSTLKAHLTSSLSSLRSKDKEVLSYLNLTGNDLTTQIHSVDKKYERFLRNLSSDFTRKISDLEQKCPCTRPPAPTTAKPKPTLPKSIISNWPEGDYALVRPETGCPNPNATGRSLFETLAYDVPWDNALYRGSKSTHVKIKLMTKNGVRTNELKYCVKDASIPLVNSSSPWPKGSYCINKFGNTCPSGFDRGYAVFVVNYFQTDMLLGTYKIEYCCRSDGFVYHYLPIHLPKVAPFYLLRQGDTCQKVQGMTVTDHLLQLQLELKFAGTSGVKNIRVNPSGHHVALAGPHLSSIALCYYQPK